MHSPLVPIYAGIIGYGPCYRGECRLHWGLLLGTEGVIQAALEVAFGDGRHNTDCTVGYFRDRGVNAGCIVGCFPGERAQYILH